MNWIWKCCVLGVVLVLAAAQSEPAADPGPINVPPESSPAQPPAEPPGRPFSDIAATEFAQGTQKPKAPLSRGPDSWTPLGKTGDGGSPPWEPLTGQTNQNLPYDTSKSQMTIGEQIMQKRQQQQQQQPQQYDIFGLPINNNAGEQTFVDIKTLLNTLTSDVSTRKARSIETRHRRQVDRFDWSSEPGHNHDTHMHPPKPPTTAVPLIPGRRPPPPPPIDVPKFHDHVVSKQQTEASKHQFSNFNSPEIPSHQAPTHSETGPKDRFSNVKTPDLPSRHPASNYHQSENIIPTGPTFPAHNFNTPKPRGRHFSLPPVDTHFSQYVEKPKAGVPSLFPNENLASERHFSALPSGNVPVPYPMDPSQPQKPNNPQIQYHTDSFQRNLAPSPHISNPNRGNILHTPRYTDLQSDPSGQEHYFNSQYHQGQIPGANDIPGNPHYPKSSYPLGQIPETNSYQEQPPVYPAESVADSNTFHRQLNPAGPAKHGGQTIIYKTQGHGPEHGTAESVPNSPGSEAPLELGTLLGDMNTGQGHSHSHSPQEHEHIQSTGHGHLHSQPIIVPQDQTHSKPNGHHLVQKTQFSTDLKQAKPAKKNSSGANEQSTNLLHDQAPVHTKPTNTKTTKESPPTTTSKPHVDAEAQFVLMFDTWYAEKFGNTSTQQPKKGSKQGNVGGKTSPKIDKQALFQEFMSMYKNQQPKETTTVNPESNNPTKPPSKPTESATTTTQHKPTKATETTTKKPAAAAIDVAPKRNTPAPTEQTTYKIIEITKPPSTSEWQTTLKNPRQRHPALLRGSRGRATPASFRGETSPRPPTTARPSIDPDLLADINEARSYQGLPALLPHQVDLQGNILPFYKRHMFGGRLPPSMSRPNLFHGQSTFFSGSLEGSNGRGQQLRPHDAHAHNLELTHQQIHMEAGSAMTPELHRQIHQLLRHRHENSQRNNLFASMQTQAPIMDPDLMADIMEAQSAASGMMGRI